MELRDRVQMLVADVEPIETGDADACFDQGRRRRMRRRVAAWGSPVVAVTLVAVLVSLSLPDGTRAPLITDPPDWTGTDDPDGPDRDPSPGAPEGDGRHARVDTPEGLAWVELVTEQTAGGGVDFWFVNHGEVEVLTGLEFTAERWEDGRWIPIPPGGFGVPEGFEDVGYSIAPGDVGPRQVWPAVPVIDLVGERGVRISKEAWYEPPGMTSHEDRVSLRTTAEFLFSGDESTPGGEAPEPVETPTEPTGAATPIVIASPPVSTDGTPWPDLPTGFDPLTVTYSNVPACLSVPERPDEREATAWLREPRVQAALRSLSDSGVERRPGVLGSAIDYDTRQMVFVVDPAGSLTAAEYANEVAQLLQIDVGLGIHVQVGCRTVAQLEDIQRDITDRHWHPDAREATISVGISPAEGVVSVSICEDEPGEHAHLSDVLRTRHGDAVVVMTSGPRMEWGWALRSPDVTPSCSMRSGIVVPEFAG